MPILFILNYAIAIFFAVHVVRTGRQMYWIMILLIFPALGSLVYFLAEYLPEMRHSTVARKSARVVKSLVDPNRELREARLAFERTPTVDNRSRLAEALLARGDYDEAIEQFQACASGPVVTSCSSGEGVRLRRSAQSANATTLSSS